MSEFGYYLSLDMNHCDLEKISSIRTVANFYVELLVKLDMVNHRFVIDRYGNNHNIYGISFVALIDQSSICGHFVESDEENPRCYIDIFTCCELDKEECEEVVKLFFGTEKSSIITNYHLR